MWLIPDSRRAEREPSYASAVPQRELPHAGSGGERQSHRRRIESYHLDSYERTQVSDL